MLRNHHATIRNMCARMCIEEEVLALIAATRALSSENKESGLTRVRRCRWSNNTLLDSLGLSMVTTTYTKGKTVLC